MEDGSGSEPTTPSASSSTDTVTTGDLPSRPDSPLYGAAAAGAKHKRPAYETPRDGQRITLLDMPEEVLMEIIMKLDADALSKCYRVSCRAR